MVKSQLPELNIGDEVGGCIYLGKTQGEDKGKGGMTMWQLRCICGNEITRRASEHWYFAKRGIKKLCKLKHLHTDIRIGSRFGKLDSQNIQETTFEGEGFGEERICSLRLLMW